MAAGFRGLGKLVFKKFLASLLVGVKTCLGSFNRAAQASRMSTGLRSIQIFICPTLYHENDLCTHVARFEAENRRLCDDLDLLRVGRRSKSYPKLFRPYRPVNQPQHSKGKTNGLLENCGGLYRLLRPFHWRHLSTRGVTVPTKKAEILSTYTNNQLGLFIRV